ncbi:hypothetical protein E2C01_007911 [Portunus trituberculatus]|uniref:Uncharacterized protein n=1 Tax=Portunus trituberculatus TaxID=210409 RepID=A0A5B7D0Y1_PORTR|nr:hypothetical protein [Portunus trituberculatus]
MARSIEDPDVTTVEAEPGHSVASGKPRGWHGSKDEFLVTCCSECRMSSKLCHADIKQAVVSHSTRMLDSSCGVMERRPQTLVTKNLGLLARL